MTDRFAALELAFIPVALDALVLPKASAVVGPLARFDLLPWTDGKRDHNSNRPWLGQSVQRAAFQPPDLMLAAGVHLHWTLPDGMTRAAPDQNFPNAPDRWLVRRLPPGAADFDPSLCWIVESDHVVQTADAEAITWPVMEADPGTAPFLRLGRALPLLDWLRQAPSARRQRVTAVGYGEAVFAAFYPACRNLFGFHDATARLDQPLTYDVLGWHSQPDEDPLGDFLARHGLSGGTSPAWDALHRFGWRFSELKDADYRTSEPPPPGRLLCYGRLVLRPNRTAPPRPVPQVALAEVGSQALPALAAAGHAAEARAGVEAALAALHHLPEFANRKVDRGPALAAARHEATFLAEAGGHVWVLRPLQETGEAAAATPALSVLPPTLASHLQDLNLLQAQFDQATDALASLRARLYADWSKYALATTTDRGKGQGAPDLDALRGFLQAGDLAQIAAATTALGSFGLHFDAAGALTDSAAPGAEDSLTDRVGAQALRGLRKLAVFNATGLSGRRKGEPLLQTDAAVGGYLQFNGYTTALALDWIDGWGSWPRMGPDGLGAVTVWLRLRPDAAKEAEILSFDGKAHFAVELVKRGGEMRFAFRTCDALGTADLLVSDAAVVLGQWVDLVAVYDAATGVKQLYDGPKLIAGKVLASRPRLGGQVHRLGVLGAGSMDEDRSLAAGMRRFKGGVARVVVMPGQAVQPTQIAGLVARPLPQPLALKRDAGPRFWRPRDPVVMLQGPAAAASDRHQRGTLRCHRVEAPPPPPATARGPKVLKALAGLSAAADAVLAGGHDAGLRRGDGAPWHPLMIEWETVLHPAEGQDGHYGADFVKAGFALEPEGPDLAPLPGPSVIPTRQSVTTGRAILTPHAAQTHARRQRAALDLLPADRHPTVPAALALDGVQSQALGGFHQALLQHREGLGLPPDDPLAFAGRRSLSRDVVRAAVGSQGIAATSPDQPFVPIRAGHLELRRLRLIDAFGQVMEVPVDRLHRPDRLAHPAHPALIRLAPRLAQPARLNFRWLSADRGAEEMNDHPVTSAICGWVVPNYLDMGLQVHDAAGRMLGEVTGEGAQPWRAVPGEDAPPQPETLQNAALGRVLRQLVGLPSAQRMALIAAVQDALDTIHPALDTDPAALGLITGRPLAIVRASLSLQIKGLPAVDHSWPALARDMNRRSRETAGFEEVRFPVRLGEQGRLEDGLVGYWREDAGGLPEGPFHAPALTTGQAEAGIVGRDDPGFALNLTLAGGAQTVTMLMDPVGAVHATSGIVPVKSIRIPPEHYATPLQAIGAAFLTGPVLAPGGRIALPLPTLPQRGWSWAERGPAGGWLSIAGANLLPPRSDGAFEGPTALREGWLVLAPDRSGGAA